MLNWHSTYDKEHDKEWMLEYWPSCCVTLGWFIKKSFLGWCILLHVACVVINVKKWKAERPYTLRKFCRYNKASLGELVPLEILGKNQQGLTWGIWPRYYLLYLLDISLGLSKGCTKCQGSKAYLVVSSKIYESVGTTSKVQPKKEIRCVYSWTPHPPKK